MLKIYVGQAYLAFSFSLWRLVKPWMVLVAILKMPGRASRNLLNSSGFQSLCE